MNNQRCSGPRLEVFAVYQKTAAYETLKGQVSALMHLLYRDGPNSPCFLRIIISKRYTKPGSTSPVGSVLGMRLPNTICCRRYLWHDLEVLEDASCQELCQCNGPKVVNVLVNQ
jgi:hypothetical protein